MTRVWAAAFSPCGRFLAAGTEDGTTRLWEAATGELLLEVHQPQDVIVTAVALSPDLKTLATGGIDGKICLWKMDGPLVRELPARHIWVTSITFSPDSKVLWSSSRDHTVRRWEVATGVPLGDPLYHQGEVWAVALSPDGATAVTGSGDGTARLWDAATGKPIGGTLRHQGAIQAVAFSPDGATVATGAQDKTARLWRVPAPVEGEPERLILWIQVLVGMERDNHGVNHHILDGETWKERRQQLEKLGEPSPSR